MTTVVAMAMAMATAGSSSGGNGCAGKGRYYQMSMWLSFCSSNCDFIDYPSCYCPSAPAILSTIFDINFACEIRNLFLHR